jgi:hypothetical protein
MMTESTPSIKTVFGFINRHGADEYPAPLITVVESNGELFGVYPNCKVLQLSNESKKTPASKEEVSARESFTQASAIIQSDNFSALTSFGIAADKIVVGTVRQVFDAIDTEIYRDQHTGESLQRLITAHHEWGKFLGTSPTHE